MQTRGSRLKVGKAGDACEREADRVAAGGWARGDQLKSGGGRGTADVGAVLGGASHPLDERTRAAMEPRFGHDFSRVRVHSDAAASDSADSLDARAYTAGEHLVFGAGEYRPGSADGDRLLAHELTHVVQQRAGGPMIQREEKAKVPRGPASGSTKMLLAAERKAPCACLVFMHHSETNARAAAEALHALCNYNLAIVAPPPKDDKDPRKISVNNVGKVDPNELFPRHVFRECVDDDKPCENFLTDNKDSTKKDVSLEVVQRQFFLQIKKCSKGFSLPIVSLHTNVVSDTAEYRKTLDVAPIDKRLASPKLSAKVRADLEKKKKSLQEIKAKIQGKTFTDLTPGKDELPFQDLEKWMLENMPELVKKAEPEKPAAKKKREAEGKPLPKTTVANVKKRGVLAQGMTNIFRWCLANDNARCYIGDPDHPDNVVWVDRQADFDTLRAKKPTVNVALQTRVTPGESETDLSSMFIGNLHDDVTDRLNREPAQPAFKSGPSAWSTFGNVVDWLERSLKRVSDATDAEKLVVAKREKVRFLNIETGQATRSGAERLGGYREVKTTLQALGLHCCTDAADKDAEKSVESGTKPDVQEL